MKTVKTPKGTDLPLINLKGKDYLQVAHRLIWFNEASERFSVETEFLVITDDQTVARAKVIVLNTDGSVLKSATATKRETKKDFPDHTEKAETGAIGRALALMGYGTQFAVADLDEGNRLADAPVVNTKTATKEVVAPVAEPRKLSSFRKPKSDGMGSGSANGVTNVVAQPALTDDWS